MEPKEWECRPERNLSIAREVQLQSVGWRSRQNSSWSPAAGEVFFLTFLFIEQAMRFCGIRRLINISNDSRRCQGPGFRFLRLRDTLPLAVAWVLAHRQSS